MRSILYILVMFGYSALAFGQPDTTAVDKKNNWRFLTGYSLYGGGDVTGITFTTEYSRNLTGQFRIGPNVKMAAARNIILYDGVLSTAQFTSLLELGVMGYYEYLNPDKSGIEFGLGGFYRYLRHDIATGPNTEYLGSTLRVAESSIGTLRESTVGFNVYIGVAIHISDMVKLNLGGLLQSDTGGNGGYGIFGGVNVKF